MSQVMERLEDRVRMSARPGRRAHAIHEQGVRRFARSGIERQRVGADTLEGDAAALQLGEERLEPERVLVEDPDRLLDEQENARSRFPIP
jgi:hypothetical protein